MIRCVAIDDEPLALEVIEKFCRRAGGMELRTFSDPAEGIAAIEADRPDLVFLDIEMENVTGLSIAARLDKDICFIFTTAYLDYALEGFNLDAVDYLHKPFSYDRFRTAVDKAVRRIEYNRVNASRGSITVKQEYNNVNIPLSEILYIEAMEGYSKIFRTGGLCTVSRIILKNLCMMLPPHDFLRVHRSFVVSVGKIESYTRQELRLVGGTVVPVGRQYADELFSRLSAR